MFNLTEHQTIVALLLVVIILIAWQLCKSYSVYERVTGQYTAQGQRFYGYMGSGLPHQVYTSGATMRRIAQQFSSTNQGIKTTMHGWGPEGGDLAVIITPDYDV